MGFRRVVLLLLLGGWSCKTPAPPEKTPNRPALELLGSLELPPTRALDAPVGGLSDLAYDAAQDTLWALSDDRSERGATRIHAFRVQHDGAKPTGLELLRTMPMLDEEAHTFGFHALDPEGLAVLNAEDFVFSSEGITNKGIPPFVARVKRVNAQLVERFPIPEAFLPDASGADQKRGVLENYGFEALGVCPDGTVLAMNEAPLKQDPPGSTQLHVLRWSTTSSPVPPPQQWEYAMEPAPVGVLVHGVTSLLCLGTGNVLVLERSWGKEAGFFNRIFTVDFTVTPARKTLLLDLNSIPLRRDNYEGMTLGPTLSDGRRTMFVVSDDNFLPEQATVLAWLVFNRRAW
jgi:hypothetical protein